MIHFNHIIIEGFGSIIEPIKYNLDSPGLNIIAGKNGSGKTTIVSAIFWVLYGDVIKKKSEITPWDHLKPRDFRGTKVSISFSTDKGEHYIIRCKDYKNKVDGIKGSNNLFWYPVSGKRSEIRDKRDIQRDIIKYLGLSSRLFTNSIVFGQNLTRLMGLSGSEQKDIIDEVLETSFINKAREKATKDSDEIIEKVRYYQNEVEKLENRLNDKKELIEQLTQQIANFEDLKNEEIKELETELEGMQSSLDKANKKQARYKDYKDKIKRIEGRIDKINGWLLEHNGEMRTYDDLLEEAEDQKDMKAHLEESSKSLKKLRKESRLTDIFCETCGQKIRDNTKYLKNKKKEIAEKQQLIDQCEDKYQKLMAKANKLKSSISDYKDKEKTLLFLKKKLEIWKEKAGKNQSDLIRVIIMQFNQDSDKLAKLRNKKCDIDIEEPKRQYREIQKMLKKESLSLRKYQMKQNQYTWLLAALGNRGLKAFIFSHMVEIINDRLNDYSQLIHFQPVFNIDLESGYKNLEIVVYRYEHLVPYSSLSGGEKQLVDICLAFSIHDVVMMERETNLLVMDEVFEGLDDSNIELVTRLIELKAQGLSLHLITHKKEFTTSAVNSTELEMQRGIGTVIVS